MASKSSTRICRADIAWTERLKPAKLIIAKGDPWLRNRFQVSVALSVLMAALIAGQLLVGASAPPIPLIALIVLSLTGLVLGLRIVLWFLTRSSIQALLRVKHTDNWIVLKYQFDWGIDFIRMIPFAAIKSTRSDDEGIILELGKGRQSLIPSEVFASPDDQKLYADEIAFRTR